MGGTTDRTGDLTGEKDIPYTIEHHAQYITGGSWLGANHCLGTRGTSVSVLVSNATAYHM